MRWDKQTEDSLERAKQRAYGIPRQRFWIRVYIIVIAVLLLASVVLFYLAAR
jgi:hypothetical protein